MTSRSAQPTHINFSWDPHTHSRVWCSGVQRGVQTVRRPRASSLGASRSPFKKKLHVNAEKKVVKKYFWDWWDIQGARIRNVLLCGEKCDKMENFGEWILEGKNGKFWVNDLTKGYQKFWREKMENFGDEGQFFPGKIREILPWASKNLVGPGHPRTSARHWCDVIMQWPLWFTWKYFLVTLTVSVKIN